MAAPVQSGIKQVYIDHFDFDTALQPINEVATAGVLVRTDYQENLLGHRSGMNDSANQTVAKISPIYSTFTTVPQKETFRDEQDRGNPNGY